MSSRRSDRGTSLLEVTITAALLVTVGGAILGVFDSTSKASYAHDEVLDARQRVRQAVAEVVGDLRGAREIAAPAGSADAAGEIEMLTAMGWVRYAWNGSDLVRELRDAPDRDPVSVRRVLGSGAVQDPTFRYFAQDGSELRPGDLPAAELVACATRVEVSLTARSDSGERTASFVGAAAPRGRRAEDLSC